MAQTAVLSNAEVIWAVDSKSFRYEIISEISR
jgi:hypothetical protein